MCHPIFFFFFLPLPHSDALDSPLSLSKIIHSPQKSGLQCSEYWQCIQIRQQYSNAIHAATTVAPAVLSMAHAVCRPVRTPSGHGDGP